MKGTGIIVVHAGAGYHARQNETRYNEICRQACEKGRKLLVAGCRASDVAVAALMVLEDSEWTNAGCGSNLTLSGTIEMDAAVMSGDGTFGAVGAVDRIKNPSQAAKLIHDFQRDPYADGRLPPCVLTGCGARDFAASHDVQILSDNSSLITNKALRQHKKYSDIIQRNCLETKSTRLRSKKRLASMRDTPSHSKTARVSAESPTPYLQSDSSTNGVETIVVEVGSSGVRDVETNETEGLGMNSKLIGTTEDKLQDTVGVVVLDIYGDMAAACSSGGIAMKHPGRIGQVCMPGAGTWVNRQTCITTSGGGEHIIKTLIAKCVADDLSKNHPFMNSSTSQDLESSEPCTCDTLTQSDADNLQMDQSNSGSSFTSNVTEDHNTGSNNPVANKSSRPISDAASDNSDLNPAHSNSNMASRAGQGDGASPALSINQEIQAETNRSCLCSTQAGSDKQQHSQATSNQVLLAHTVNSSIKQNFIESEALKDCDRLNLGMVVLHKLDEESVEAMFAFTSMTFSVGYATTATPPHTEVLRHVINSTSTSTSAIVSGVTFTVSK